MTAKEIININGSNLDAYTAEQRQIVKDYGWKEYGLNFADTVRIETKKIDHIAYLDATFC